MTVDFSSSREPSHIKSITNAFSNLEFGDVLAFLYIAVFVRQYFWIVSANGLAWILTTIVSVIVWILYLITKPSANTDTPRRTNLSFWLIVAIPLTIAFLLRAAFPDRSFDVINYHILNSERTLRGPLFQPGDFFHSVPFNPAADTITGITRWILGYRLGTVINLFALIWVAQIVEKVLRRFITNSWWCSLSVLGVMLLENLFFEISTYMIDLLMLPLLLQATLLTLDLEETPVQRNALLHIALLLGACVALKFTTLAVVLPLCLVCAYKVLFGSKKWKPREVLTSLPLLATAFIAPLAAFIVYIYRITGNPLFPVANPFFRSPYWPVHGGWDNRWGPHTLVETIIWPVLIWLKPERYTELAVYSGRLSFAIIVAVVGLPLVWANVRARIICLLLIATSLLWSKSAMGYSRYGLYQDLLAGITVVTIGAVLFSQRSAWRSVVASVLFIVLAAQSFTALGFALNKEWGERTTFIKDPDVYASEAHYFLRDRSLNHFLTDEQRAKFEKVKVWFETGPKTSGIEVLLNPEAPIIALRQQEFFASRISWQHFIQKVEALSSQPMYSLCLNADVPAAKKFIAERGLELGQTEEVSIPFFSPRNPIGMMLLEIRVPQDAAAREQFETAWLKSAFPSTDYREQIEAANPPSSMRVGEKMELTFKVKNLGSMTWPAVGTKDFRYQVNLGNHWILNGNASEDSRAVMSGDLAPGAETDIRMTVKAPATPGDYILEIDLVHEGVTWFKEQGATPLSLRVAVRP